MKQPTPRETPHYESTAFTRRTFLAGAAGLLASKLVGCGTTEQPPTTTGERFYPEHRVTATKFWVGEPPSEENAYISNEATAWDSHPVKRFGGVDDPDNPPETVLHNRYYFALPVNEFDENGLIPGIRERSPWRGETVGENQSLFKGRWIKATNASSGQSVYAQWLDTGPCDTGTCNDPDYVFGSQPPQNDFGLRAGLDLSPSAMKALGADGSAEVVWKFVDETEVPGGPWRDDPPITNETFWE